MATYLFPKWTNSIKYLALVALMGGPVYATALIWIGFSPNAISRGYRPEQPVPFSHRLHAGELGMDCRYCHTTVEKAGFAAIPPTDTCMNCHNTIHTDSPLLEPIRESYESGMPVLWTKVHDLPDYAYFNHSAHIAGGVSCVECHGRVDRMDVVEQMEPLSMSWCLDCHRNPQEALRPVELVTKLDLDPANREWSSVREQIRSTDTPSLNGWNWEDSQNWEEFQKGLMAHYQTNTSVDCSTCHR